MTLIAPSNASSEAVISKLVAYAPADAWTVWLASGVVFGSLLAARRELWWAILAGGFVGAVGFALYLGVGVIDAHGYGVIEYVRSASGGRFDYPDGTVYPALHRLEAEGLLRSRWSEVDGRRRRVYEITGRGKKAIAGQRRDWERFTSSVTAVLEQT